VSLLNSRQRVFHQRKSSKITSVNQSRTLILNQDNL
jgi:hypothetical protein